MPRKAAPQASPRPARKTKHDSARTRRMTACLGSSSSSPASPAPERPRPSRPLRTSATTPSTTCRWICCRHLPTSCGQSAEIQRAALVVDVREGQRLDQFPVPAEQAAQGSADPGLFPRGVGRGAAAALLRDPPPAPAGTNGDRRQSHRCRAAPARSDSQGGGRDCGYLAAQCARAARLHPEQVRARQQ